MILYFSFKTYLFKENYSEKLPPNGLTDGKKDTMGRWHDIGRISDVLARPWVVVLLVAQAVLLIYIAAYYHGSETSEGCLYCHADKARMEKEGYPQFYMTREQVERESRMPGVTCRDCHLGNGKSRDADEAHSGMPRMMVLDSYANPMKRKGLMDSSMPSGGDRMYAVFPKVEEEGELYPDPDAFTVLWHDRDPKTLGYDMDIAMKTCGRKGCHTAEVLQFDKTDMGGNVRQRSMRHWTDAHGPNNCGPSLADLPADAGSKAGYSPANYEIVRDSLSCPSTYEQATDRQRYCNVCHSGCMDCHYNPNPKDGVHSFTRRVPSTNCSGGGRGTGMCHAGTMERRRGDTYLGLEFSQPPGMPADPHYKAGLECVDCHETGEKGMGDIQRKVDCAGCHYFITQAHEKGVHKGLRCQACHVNALGGYEMTVWGKGNVRGKESPFKKYSLYYGVMERPILVKDYEGKYTPYKIWPNIATNIKGDMPKKEGIQFRWSKGETRDAYAQLGTYGGMPGANKALAWMQLDAVGHPLAKSRTCGSCHEDTVQRAHEDWEYLYYTGSEPFTGEQDVVADKDGLRVVNIRKTSRMKLVGDAEIWDFAAWVYLKDIWDVKGDFSIPKADERKYRSYKEAGETFNKGLKRLEDSLKGTPPGKEHDSLERRIRKIRGIGAHDPEAGLRELDKVE